MATTKNIPKILMKLCEKVGRRLRKNELRARTVFISLRLYKQKSISLHKKSDYPLRSTLDIYHHAVELLKQVPAIARVSVLSIGVSNLTAENYQLSWLNKNSRQAMPSKLDDTMDKIKEKHGSFSIMHGTMLGAENFVPDRIAFGK